MRFSSLALAAFLAPLAMPSGAWNLTVIHTNDMHAGYGGLQANGLACYDSRPCRGGRGGAVRLARAVAALRKASPEALLLDAGDQIQGTLYSLRFNSVLASEMNNTLGYDAFIFGNHEFDAGLRDPAYLAAHAKAPILTSNITGMNLKTRNWAVIEKGGHRIGVFGMTTRDTPNLSSPPPEVQFTDLKEAAEKAVAELHAQGVKTIIAITHIGLDVDEQVARGVSGVTLWVGGHTHTMMGECKDYSEAPYPVVVTDRSGRKVPIVTAGHSIQLVGHIDLDVGEDGYAKSWKGDTILLTEKNLATLGAAADNRTMAGMLAPKTREVRKLLGSGIGLIKGLPNGKALDEPSVMSCRKHGCRTASLMADAFAARTKVPVALVNAGAARNVFAAGKVRAGDILTVMPFEDTLVTCQNVPGSVLREALTVGLRGYGPGKGHGHFLQVSGLRYAFHPVQPMGAKLVSAEVRGADGRWKPLDDEASYSVTVPSYIAKGSDGFKCLKSIAWRSTGLTTQDAVRQYLARRGGVQVPGKERAVIVDDPK